MKTRFILLLTLGLGLSSYNTKGQVSINLTIDISCISSSQLKMEGKFELYEMVSVTPYSSATMDTLVKQLDYVATQTLNLSQGHYKIIFTPLDSILASNVYYFYTYTNMPDIDLTCFFFNRNYPSFLERMKSTDTLIFYSSYYGNTHEEMRIPASQTSIIKKGDGYYMAYKRCDYYQHNPIPTQARTTGKHLIKLTKRQVQLLGEFETQILEGTIRNNLTESPQAFNKIYGHNKAISFYSNFLFSDRLYQRITSQ